MLPTSLVLASGSPRRHDLLRTLGVSFTSATPDVDETRLDEEDPKTFVERVARTKVVAVGSPKMVTLGADTTVVVDDRVLGKPVDAADARRMLGLLAGRAHLVHTGVALVVGDVVTSSVTTSEVTITPMTLDRIEWYVATGEPLDKAGAYALQGIGGIFVERVNGDPFNVIGLPLAATAALFQSAGLDLLAFRDEA